MSKGFAAVASACLAWVGTAGIATAGEPAPWQMGFQAVASPAMRELTDFHDLLLVIITVITVFVVALLGYAMVRFRAARNPNPSQTTHNTILEVVWTVVPIMILVIIAIPSFKLLYFTDRVANADMTIKAIGHQWYWSYEYPDHGGFTFDSLIVADEDLEEGQPRLLATDTNIVVPVNTIVRVLVTADDVLHAWAVPALGVKIDAVPGRLNETWIEVEAEGIYYGQCSELCGTNHGFMPIAVQAVSKEDFDTWVEKAKEEFAALPEPTAPDGVAVASAKAGN